MTCLMVSIIITPFNVQTIMLHFFSPVHNILQIESKRCVSSCNGMNDTKTRSCETGFYEDAFRFSSLKIYFIFCPCSTEGTCFIITEGCSSLFLYTTAQGFSVQTSSATPMYLARDCRLAAEITTLDQIPRIS